MKITFVPEDKDIFKNKIIETKFAIRIIEYMDGTIREEPWRIKNFNNTSGLLHNIESQRWYTKDKFNIKEVVITAGNAQTRESLNLFKGSVKKVQNKNRLLIRCKGVMKIANWFIIMIMLTLIKELKGCVKNLRLNILNI